jgi:DNA replication protein DnaC
MDKKVKEILDNRKYSAEQTANDNLNKAFSLPEFKKLYQKEQSLIMERAKNSALGKDFVDGTLNETIRKQNDILKSLGLTKTDLTANYTCKKCQDTGYVLGELCDCVNQINSLINLEKIEMKALKTFKDSDLSVFKNSKIVELYKRLQLWIKNNKRKKVSLLLSGSTGTGKTFLLQCLASELINQNKYVIYTTAFEMNNDLLKYHTTFNEEKMKYIDKYLQCDALVIDDLGTEPIYKNITIEYLYLILNQRMIERKITLLSTNLKLDDIRDRYGERIFSRMVNKEQNIMFELKDEDLRLKRN